MATWMRLAAILIVVASLLTPGSAPEPQVRAAEPTVIVRSDFEDGTTQGWEPRGSGVSVSAVTEVSHAGSYSLKTTGRSANWHGPSLNLLGRLQPGVTYVIEAYVRLVAGQPTSTLKLTMQRTPSGGATQYEPIAMTSDASDGAWTRLSGSYTFSGDVSDLHLYLESSDPTSQYYLDDLTISQLSDGGGAPAPGVSSDFEDGTTQGWGPRVGREQVTVTTAERHSGSYSLLTTGRQQPYDGPSLNILGRMTRGARYHVSVWVKLAPGEPDSLIRVSIQRSFQGTTNYNAVVGNTPVTANAWVQLQADYTLTAEVDALSIYVESDSGTPSFYIDDFALTYVPPQPLPPIQTDIPSVYQTLADYFPIGAAIEPFQLDSERHVQLLTRHFNAIVAENVMKPGPLQPSEGQFNWGPADRLVQFAQAHDMRMRGHTLVWHNQNPDWLFQDADGNPLQPTPEHKALLLQRLEQHIRAVMGRYAGFIRDWDVVNEVVDPNQPDCMRRSPWYAITGTDYIKTAFRVAREVAPDARLYINDFSTTEPRKRQCIYDLVRELRAQGVPIDGIGHQMHINIASPSGAEIEQTIQLFADLGLDNQITELDMSLYTNDFDRYTTIPEDLLIRQGYRYKEVFDAFRNQHEHISLVTFWGIADDHTWLKSYPIERLDLPLLFDEQQQAKPAYWGVVDPSRLPVLIQRREVPQGVPRIDGQSELFWEMLPATELSTEPNLGARFRLLWDASTLYVLAEVQDATPDREDRVELFLDENNAKSTTYQDDDRHFVIRRDICAWPEARYRYLLPVLSHGAPIQSSASPPAPAAAQPQTCNNVRVVPTATGYRVEAAITLVSSATPGREIGFDLRVTDASRTDRPLSWSDTTDAQDQDTSKWGVLTLTPAIKLTRALQGTPTIDAQPDPLWEAAPVITTSTRLQGSSGATATVRLLWDSAHLYVLAEVSDGRLSKASINPWEQDSVEIFIDQNNAKTNNYQADDGQYRVNYDNEQSFGGAASAEKLTSATRLVPGGYVVEAAIALDAVAPRAGLLLGFDAQVNDDADGDGTRDSVATWNDRSGQAYQDASRFGVVELVAR